MSGRASRYALMLLCAVTIAVRCAMPQRQVLTWDVFGYYLYLPATFIHHDIALRDDAWLDEVMTTDEPSSTLYQVVDGPDGNRVIKYSSGMAVLYAPFFFVAHALADPLGYAADGFSEPYQIAITIGCLAFALLGLVLFRNVLLHFFDDRWTAALLVLIGLGTNWFQLTAWDGTLLTHSALFTLYALLLLATIRWHAAPSWRWALWIGSSVGLITLIRPSELVAVLIPLFWGLRDAQALKAKWNAVRNNIPQLLGAALLFLVAVSPQLFYWKITAGQWIFYSYVNPGEGFDLDTPHLRPFLVSFRKGWFIYTPLMLVAIGGIAFLWKRIPQAFWAVLVFLIVDVWIVSSWSCWWYAGGSFSSRSMVPAYVLLALPLGAALQWASMRRPWRVTAIALCSAFVLLNLFQTWQWTAGIITKERMTKVYYRAAFGRMTMPPNAEDLLLVHRPLDPVERFTDEARYTERTLFHDGYDQFEACAKLLTPEDRFAAGPDITYEGITAKDHAWIRASTRLWVGEHITSTPALVITFHHKGHAYKYVASGWEIPPDARNTWVTLTVDYLTPEVRSRQDNMKIYIWDHRGGTHLIDDLTVKVYERK